MAHCNSKPLECVLSYIVHVQSLLRERACQNKDLSGPILKEIRAYCTSTVQQLIDDKDRVSLGI